MDYTADDFRECPMCGERILKWARKCRFCGEVLDITLREAREAKELARSVATSQSVIVQTVAAPPSTVHVIHKDAKKKWYNTSQSGWCGCLVGILVVGFMLAEASRQAAERNRERRIDDPPGMIERSDDPEHGGIGETEGSEAENGSQDDESESDGVIDEHPAEAEHGE